MPGSKWSSWVGGNGRYFGTKRPICGYRPARLAFVRIGAIRPVLGGSTGGMRGFMRRDEVVAALRQVKKDRCEMARLQDRVAAFEKAWRGLSREEQEILERLVVENKRGNVEWLCGELDIEKSAVYRRRDKALMKLGERL